jgi:hypothetical protein
LSIPSNPEREIAYAMSLCAFCSLRRSNARESGGAGGWKQNRPPR